MPQRLFGRFSSLEGLRLMNSDIQPAPAVSTGVLMASSATPAEAVSEEARAMSAARRARLKATVELSAWSARPLDKCYAAAELMHKKAEEGSRELDALADSPDAAARSRALDVAYVYWQRYAACFGMTPPASAASSRSTRRRRTRPSRARSASRKRGCGRASARASPSSSGSSTR